MAILKSSVYFFKSKKRFSMGILKEKVPYLKKKDAVSCFLKQKMPYRVF